MSNNVATNTKNEGRCSFSRKALSVATAAVLATTMVPMLPAESAWAADTQAEQGNGTVNQNITLAVQNVRFDSDANIVFDLSVTLPSPVSGSNKFLTAGVYDENGDSVLVDSTDKRIDFDSTSEAVVSNLVIDSAKVDKGEEVTVLVKGASGKEAELDVAIPAAATDADYFSMGEVTEVVDANDRVLTANEDGSYSIEFGNSLKSVSVKPAILALDEPVKIDSGIMYAKEEAGKDADELAYNISTLAGQPSGTYYAKVSGTGSYTGGAVYVKVTVETEQLGDIYAVEGTDVEDTTLNFVPGNGKIGDVTVGFASGENMIDAADIDKIEVFDANGKAVSGSSYASGAVTMPSMPGSYKAKITFGANSEFGAVTKVVDFMINKLDLSKVDFSIADQVYSQGSNVNLDNVLMVGKDTAANLYFDNVADWSLVSNELGAEASAKGSYEVEITPKSGNAYVLGQGTANPVYVKVSDLVEGSKTVSFDIIGTDVSSNKANFKYDGEQFDTFFTNREFVNDGESDPFTPSLIKVVKDGSVSPVKYFSSDEIEVVVEKQNADTTWSEVSSYTATGDYRVTVKVLGSATDYEFGGSQTGYFHVTNGDLNFNDVFVTWNGEAVTNGKINAVYDGENVIDEIGLTVRYGDKTLVAGTDYKVEYTLDGEAVDSIVNAGDYKMTITPLTYDGAKTVVDIHVGKLPVTDVRVDSPDFMDQGKLAYTGTDIDFAVEAQYAGNLFASSDYESTVLPTDAYKVSGLKYKAKATDKDWTPVDSVKEVGLYTATVTIYGDAENYSGTSYPINFEVAKNVAFADVAADAWYAEAVATAADADHEYMNGIGGTNLFLPMSSITRAQVAQVFYNMAGNGGKVGTGGSDSGTASFDDVVSSQWYVPAVSWAATAGIVKGYDGTSSFGPEDNATREQVATMIYRYAGVVGLDTSVEDESGALAKYADGSSVSEFAKTAMAWCVEQGIFGVDVDTLRPQDNLCRAEMAATAVRVQPEGFIKPVA